MKKTIIDFINSMNEVDRNEFWKIMEISYNYDYSMMGQCRIEMFLRDTNKFCFYDNINPFLYFTNNSDIGARFEEFSGLKFNPISNIYKELPLCEDIADEEIQF